MFGGASLRLEIHVTKSIGLAYILKANKVYIYVYIYICVKQINSISDLSFYY